MCEMIVDSFIFISCQISTISRSTYARVVNIKEPTFVNRWLLSLLVARLIVV